MAALGLKVLSVVSNVLTGAIEAVHSITGKDKDADNHEWREPSPTDRKAFPSLVADDAAS